MDALIQANLEQLKQTSADRNAKLLALDKPTTTGTYQGYDATLEWHSVQTADGGLVYGLMESTGAAEVGQALSTTLTSGGIPRFFVIPH